MPALAFGLRAAKPPSGPPKPPAKRKAVLGAQSDDEDDNTDEGRFGGLAKKPFSSAKGDLEDGSVRLSKSPKLAHQSSQNPAKSSSRYSNLSALRSAKLQDEQASKLDASVYEFDSVYETFHADKNKDKDNSEGQSGPKYMTSLMASADVRKRDQLRAKEKLLQKERDAEGDEFADKEKFVTGAYKKQQEELKKIEAEEKKREEEEEERKRKGGGMTAFHMDVLRKDEERQKAMEAAAELVKKRREAGNMLPDDEPSMEEYKTEAKIAAELNQRGARIVVNDDGDIVDKRQLLTAGLNVAPKKHGTASAGKGSSDASKPQEWQRSTKAQDARLSQRERQSRMMERQIEEITEKQRLADLEEEKEREEKNKTKITDADKMGAKERFLQRKKEREAEAKKAKESAG